MANDPRREDNRMNADVEALLAAMREKIKQLEDREGELESVARELNAATIQKLLIEREAEKMSRRLSALQHNLKNNLFIRSVLHSLINMLQVQLSLDKEEDALIDELARAAAALPPGAGREEFSARLLPRLAEVRERTADHLHRTMMGYVKAVRRSLLGERGYTSGRPTELMHAVERVRLKYRDILAGGEGRPPVRLVIDPSAQEVRLPVFDFALINIVENLLTNSIRKVLAAGGRDPWIRLAAGRETVMNETYVVLTWSDNGGGVPAERKQSIFAGDSDKTEAGDHGVGLSDMKSMLEAMGGFIREQGDPGIGAEFVLGFPLPGDAIE